MNINYKIEFFSDWHCGSGLAAGADVDELVVKDKNGLPFIPGKTIKGLVKEALEDICSFRGDDKDELIKEAFGFFNEKDSKGKGTAFFGNATLPKNEQDSIRDNKVQEFMYRNIASTSIESNGIAKEHSLRRMETVVPCKLEGSIKDVPAGLVEDVKDALKFIKRLGTDRNRGLGRCRFVDFKEEDEK